MAIVTFSKNQFEKDFGELDEDLQNKIAMFGTPVESIKRDEVELEIFPNRPDLISYQGFKRAFLSFLGKKTGLKEYKINKPEKDYNVIIDSSVKNVRPYTACAIVRELKFDDEKIKELIETQEKLHITIGRRRKKVAIGIYPMEKIRLPITFKATEPDKIKFVPLEMDKELSGLEILQRHPAGKEYAHLLAGKAKFPVFIDADEQVLSMPPIINSHLTGKITAKTKDVFIECSGEDFEILKTCLNIIVTSLNEMGGKIYQMILHYGKKEITPDLAPKKIKISPEKINKLLGLELKEKELKKLIEKMGHNYNSKDNSVEVASWRADILHWVDIAEDVAIAYGYENFVAEIPEIATTGKEDKKEVIKKKFAEILSGLGMLEVSNYHLTNKKDQTEKMNLTEKQEFIEVRESKTEYTLLRKNLTHLLLKNFSENVDSEYPQNIFETGKVFCLKGEKGNIMEKEMLAAGIAPGNFTKIEQILEYLFSMIKKGRYETDKEIILKEPTETPSYFVEGRTAEIIFNGKKIGYIGEIHPKILKNWKIKMPVALFEIEIDDVLEEIV